MEIKICNKKQNCSHFLIEQLVKELGGLGGENSLKKIKSGEDFKKYKQKIKNLGQLLSKFESKVVEFFDSKGYYPCVDVMQICWGRRKYLACLAILKEKKISEVKK